jgi:hypothetical protein
MLIRHNQLLDIPPPPGMHYFNRALKDFSFDMESEDSSDSMPPIFGGPLEGITHDHAFVSV